MEPFLSPFLDLERPKNLNCRLDVTRYRCLEDQTAVFLGVLAAQFRGTDCLQFTDHLWLRLIQLIGKYDG